MKNKEEPDCQEYIEEIFQMQSKIADQLVIINEGYLPEKDVSDALKECISWLVFTNYEDYLEYRPYLKEDIDSIRKGRFGLE